MGSCPFPPHNIYVLEKKKMLKKLDFEGMSKVEWFTNDFFTNFWGADMLNVFFIKSTVQTQQPNAKISFSSKKTQKLRHKQIDP
jgi:CRISPR/Cas system CSM-associated protein Csm4 (group 5 of RAMP superfamily)